MDDELVKAGAAVAKQIPGDAWTRMVETACTTFESLLAPITESTSGVGRLIRHKFDVLLDAQKVLAAATMREAAEKAARVIDVTPEETQPVAPDAVIAILEACSDEIDTELRTMWANLLARVLVGRTVHKELVYILERLERDDCKELIHIGIWDRFPTRPLLNGPLGNQNYEQTRWTDFDRSIRYSVELLGTSPSPDATWSDPMAMSTEVLPVILDADAFNSFSLELLTRLGLVPADTEDVISKHIIAKVGGLEAGLLPRPQLSRTGRALLAAVVDPSYE